MARAVLIYLTLFRRLDTKEIAFLKRRESQTFWFVLSKIPILAISANWVFLLLGLPWFQNFWLFSCRRIQILAISDFVILFGNYAITRIPYCETRLVFLSNCERSWNLGRLRIKPSRSVRGRWAVLYALFMMGSLGWYQGVDCYPPSLETHVWLKPFSNCQSTSTPDPDTLLKIGWAGNQIHDLPPPSGLLYHLATWCFHVKHRYCGVAICDKKDRLLLIFLLCSLFVLFDPSHPVQSFDRSSK